MAESAVWGRGVLEGTEVGSGVNDKGSIGAAITLGTGADCVMQAQLSKQEAIEEITRRLVEFYRPVRIYLFGSEARGDAGPDSDLDFLVVVPDDVSP